RTIELNTNALIGMCLAVFTIGCLGCFYLFGFSFWLFEQPARDAAGCCGFYLHDNWHDLPICQFSGSAGTCGACYCIHFYSTVLFIWCGLAACCHAHLDASRWRNPALYPNCADVYSTQSDGCAYNTDLA